MQSLQIQLKVRPPVESLYFKSVSKKTATWIRETAAEKGYDLNELLEEMVEKFSASNPRLKRAKPVRRKTADRKKRRARH